MVWGGLEVVWGVSTDPFKISWQNTAIWWMIKIKIKNFITSLIM